MSEDTRSKYSQVRLHIYSLQKQEHVCKAHVFSCFNQETFFVAHVKIWPYVCFTLNSESIFCPSPCLMWIEQIVKFYLLPYGHDVTLVNSPSASSVLTNSPFVTIIPSYPQFLLVFEPTTIMEALKHALSRQQVCLYHFSSPEKADRLGVGVYPVAPVSSSSVEILQTIFPNTDYRLTGEMCL